MVLSNSFLPLLKFINKPSKIASVLDWKKVSGGSVLSLDIHRDRIGVAVAPHPSFSAHHFDDDYDHYGTECRTLEPIRLSTSRTGLAVAANNNDTICDTGDFKSASNGHNPHHLFSEDLKRVCRTRLLEICQEYNVCGMVVAWPLQHDTGKMGAACGRVLYTLERLFVPPVAKLQNEDGTGDGFNNSSSTQNEEEEQEMRALVSKLPPMCLWDPQHFQELQHQNPPKDPEQVVDSFGRCPAYAKAPPDKDAVYLASHEQYYHDESMVAAQVWQDFSRVHWPHLYKNDYDNYGFGEQQQHEYVIQDQEDLLRNSDVDNLHEDIADVVQEEANVEFSGTRRLGHTGRPLFQERRGSGRGNFHGSWGGIPSSVRTYKQSNASRSSHYNLNNYLVDHQEMDIKKERRIRKSLV